MIRQAWDVNTLPGDEIPGTPQWLDMYNPLIDIVAKVPGDFLRERHATVFNEDLQAMMRALLLDRFKMVRSIMRIGRWTRIRWSR